MGLRAADARARVGAFRSRGPACGRRRASTSRHGAPSCAVHHLTLASSPGVAGDAPVGRSGEGRLQTACRAENQQTFGRGERSLVDIGDTEPFASPSRVSASPAAGCLCVKPCVEPAEDRSPQRRHALHRLGRPLKRDVNADADGTPRIKCGAERRYSPLGGRVETELKRRPRVRRAETFPPIASGLSICCHQSSSSSSS